MVKDKQRLERALSLLNEIVIAEGIDSGLILKNPESPTQYDKERKCHVYLHEHFSELGDALVELHQVLSGTAD